MDIIAAIRRRHLISGESIGAIAHSFKLSHPAVHKHQLSIHLSWSHVCYQPYPLEMSADVFFLSAVAGG